MARDAAPPVWLAVGSDGTILRYTDGA